jgi:hypothetical protein
VPAVVTGDQSCVCIDVIPSCFDDTGGGEQATVVGGLIGGIQSQLSAIQSLASQMRRGLLQELQTNQIAERVSATKNFSVVNANIRRIALQPGVRGAAQGQCGRGGNDDAIRAQIPAIVGQRTAPPSLNPNPKNYLNYGRKTTSSGLGPLLTGGKLVACYV